MKISVFTPFHKSSDFALLENLFKSLEAQDRKPDEWIVLLNGDVPEKGIPLFDSSFIIRYPVSLNTGNIGALKSECCEYATGDILVEVDYDDHLTPGALQVIENVFESNHATKFAYSDAIEYKEDGSQNLYSGVYGWKHDKNQKGEAYNVSFPAEAHYLRRIEWSPNHVRAFEKRAYEEAGGYDKSIKVGDDHDLICRFYREYGPTAFAKIDAPIYYYRVHNGNTCNGQNRNKEIQEQVDRNYCNHAESMYLRWAEENGLACLDLGGRIGCPDGYKSVDLLDADVIADLNQPWPFADSSVGVLRAYHVIEHLPDTIHFFNEAYRVLAPGGFLLIEAPSVSGPGAFGDPTHVRFFNLLSFEYFTNQQFARFIQPQYTGRFQKARLVEYQWPNGIAIISAQLIALKGWYDQNWCGLKEM